MFNVCLKTGLKGLVSNCQGQVFPPWIYYFWRIPYFVFRNHSKKNLNGVCVSTRGYPKNTSDHKMEEAES